MCVVINFQLGMSTNLHPGDGMSIPTFCVRLTLRRYSSLDVEGELIGVDHNSRTSCTYQWAPSMAAGPDKDHESRGQGEVSAKAEATARKTASKGQDDPYVTDRFASPFSPFCRGDMNRHTNLVNHGDYCSHILVVA